MFFSTGAAGAFLSSQLLCTSIFLCYPDKGISQRHPDVAEPDGAVPAASTSLLKPTCRYYSPHIQQCLTCSPAPTSQDVQVQEAPGYKMPQNCFEI